MDFSGSDSGFLSLPPPSSPPTLGSEETGVVSAIKAPKVAMTACMWLVLACVIMMFFKMARPLAQKGCR